MGMTRLEHWPELLVDAVDDARMRNFEWGEFDCCLFAADCVQAMTGVDLAEPFRGRYSTKVGAVEVLAEIGNIEKYLEQLFGAPVPVLQASRGDVLTRNVDGMTALGICIGSKVAFAAPDGLTFLGLAECDQAWRV